MTYHVRRQIRDALVTRLTGLTSTGSRVYPHRVYPGDPAKLGGQFLLVTTDDEQIDNSETGFLARHLTCTVKTVAKGARFDDDLDKSIAEIETALSGQTLGGLCGPLVLTEIHIEQDDSLEKPVGVAALAWQAQYFTTAAAPTAVI